MSIMNRFAAQRRKPQAAMPGNPWAASTASKPFAMQRTGADSAEIVLYGDIVREQPTDWWGDPIEGQYIILSEFLTELKSVEDVAHLTIRIHSAGGNAYDAITMHNRLKSLSADITVIVDGVAMSGGSLIMCAGDKVQVYPGSLVMIHRCWAWLWGGYNASELRSMANSYDACDRSQAAIYQAKTGMGADELMSMMEAETYMTGQEAIDKGFADEFAEGSALEVAASADRHTLFVGSMPVWVSSRKDGIPAGIPAVIPTVNPAASATVVTNNHAPANVGAKEGGQRTMANTLEELRQENPGLAAQLEAEARATALAAAAPPVAPTAPPVQPPVEGNDGATNAAQDERRRIQDIDEVAHLFDTETVREAKYGQTPCTAQEMTYRAAQKAAQQGRSFLSDLEIDAGASGAQGVGAAASGVVGAEGDENSPQAMSAKAKADVAAFQKMKEVR